MPAARNVAAPRAVGVSPGRGAEHREVVLPTAERRRRTQRAAAEDRVRVPLLAQALGPAGFLRDRFPLSSLLRNRLAVGGLLVLRSRRGGRRGGRRRTGLRWVAFGGAGGGAVVVVGVVVVTGGGAAAGGRSALTQPMRKRVPVAKPACARVKRSSSAAFHQRSGAAAAPASIVPGRSRTPQFPMASVAPGSTVAVDPFTSSPLRFGRSFQPVPSPEAGTRSACRELPPTASLEHVPGGDAGGGAARRSGGIETAGCTDRDVLDREPRPGGRVGVAVGGRALPVGRGQRGADGLRHVGARREDGEQPRGDAGTTGSRAVAAQCRERAKRGPPPQRLRPRSQPGRPWRKRSPGVGFPPLRGVFRAGWSAACGLVGARCCLRPRLRSAFALAFA